MGGEKARRGRKDRATAQVSTQRGPDDELSCIGEKARKVRWARRGVTCSRTVTYAGRAVLLGCHCPLAAPVGREGLGRRTGMFCDARISRIRGVMVPARDPCGVLKAQAATLNARRENTTGSCN